MVSVEEDITEKARLLAEATGRSYEDVLADLADDGILNESNKDNRKDLISELKEAAELISAVQEINKEVSENSVLNGGDNKTEVAVETTLEGDIVDKAIASIHRKAMELKKIALIIAPIFLLLGGTTLEGLGIINMVGDDEDEYYDPIEMEYWGCTDWDAMNYDEYANMDDGSCEYHVYGCMNDAASNYDPMATIDDGSCEPEEPEPIYGCTDSEAENYDDMADEDDGSCYYPPDPVEGCTDDSAENYNPDADTDDGSCEYPANSDDCTVEIQNHYRGHVPEDAEQDAIIVAFKLVPTDCDDFDLDVSIELFQNGYAPNYTFNALLSGDLEHEVSHVFDGVEVGNWIPKIKAGLDGEQKANVNFWAIDVEEQEPEICEINLYVIQLFTNSTKATVGFDLDCGYESNDLEGYNVTIQFLVYDIGSQNNSSAQPILYEEASYYVEGYDDDPNFLSLNNFTSNNTTHYDFYWYAMWEDGNDEWQTIEQKWLNRELEP